MVSLLITNPTHCAFLHNPTSDFNSCSFSSPSFTLEPRKRALRYRKAAVFDYIVGKKEDFFGCFEEKRGSNSMCCWCKKQRQSEEDGELEAKILEFMEKSERPEKFPSKNELEKAGRFDLVEAIRRKGGWFSLGWEVDEEEDVREKVNASEIKAMDVHIEEFKKRVQGFEESELRENEVWASQISSFSGEDLALLASKSTLSSDKSFCSKTMAAGETGIEGILSRLEKERNSSFGIDLGKYRHGAHASGEDDPNVTSTYAG